MRRMPLLIAVIALGAGAGIGLGALPNLLNRNAPLASSSDEATTPTQLPVAAELGPEWVEVPYTPSAAVRCPLKAASVYQPLDRQWRAFQRGQVLAVFQISRYAPGDADRVIDAIGAGGEDCYSFSDDAGAWSVLTARTPGRVGLTMVNAPLQGGAPVGIEARYRRGTDSIATMMLATPGDADLALANQLEAAWVD